MVVNATLVSPVGCEMTLPAIEQPNGLMEAACRGGHFAVSTRQDGHGGVCAQWQAQSRRWLLDCQRAQWQLGRLCEIPGKEDQRSWITSVPARSVATPATTPCTEVPSFRLPDTGDGNRVSDLTRTALGASTLKSLPYSVLLPPLLPSGPRSHWPAVRPHALLVLSSLGVQVLSASLALPVV